MWAKEYGDRFERVYAFEPIAENIQCVLKNAPTVTVIPCALSDGQGYKTFKVKNGNFAHLGEGKNLVFCTTIDSFEYEGLGLIKLDIEGQEVQALEGAKKTLNKHEPALCIEVKYDGDEIRDWLRDYGYERRTGNELDEVWSAA